MNVTQLTGVLVVEGDPFTAPMIAALHDETHAGFFRRVEFSSQGVTVSRRDVRLQIPLAEILRLAEELDQRLAPYANGAPILKIEK